MARVTGCQAGTFPITYLGLPIGKSMRYLSSWNTLIDIFKSKLSKLLGSLGIYYFSIFKAPESIINFLERVRAKFFWGSSQGNNKMAWVRWDNVLASLDQGGLGIGCLKAFNLALLQKWRWRLVTNPNLLWVKLIKAIHGTEAGFDDKGCATSGVWSSIIGTTNYLHSYSILPKGSLRCHLGNGSTISFWKDISFGDERLCSRYNRLFCLDINDNCSISDRFKYGSWYWQWSRAIVSGRTDFMFQTLLTELLVFTLSTSPYQWKWSIGYDASFSVADTRLHIDHHILLTLATSIT
ncbi:hypothetical protein Tco_0733284 [Tanacetum coccineum]